MRKKILLLIFVLVFNLIPSSLSFAADGTFAGGDGSGGNPYQIEDCLDLQAMNNSMSSSYILNNDIDCSDTVNWNSGAGFVRVGNPGSKFTGGFDGNGYVIEDLTINASGTAYVALFGWVNITTEGGTIKDVGLVNANITSSSYSSTLIGWLEAGTVTNVFSTGSVTSSGGYNGGLVGSVSGGTLTDSYSTASVTVDEVYYAGGLIGIQQGGTVQYSYSTGSTTSGSGGGLIGLKTAGTLTNSFYDSTTSGRSDNTGKGTPKTTAQMKTQSTFTDWTFTVAGNGTIGDWIMAGYPHLQMEHRTTITSAVELQLMAVNLDGDYSISNNIDATAITNYLPMGTMATRFTGNLDGNGYLISNLVINQPSLESVGIIGAASGSILTELAYISGSVTGNKYVGGIVGYHAQVGSVTKSYSLVDVTSTNTDPGSETGGLIGIKVDGTVSDSYATGDISGAYDVGGLIGFSSSTLSRTYATGSVSDGDNHGGLVGRAEAQVISNSFATGTVNAADTTAGALVGSLGGGGSISGGYWNDTGAGLSCYSDGNTGCTAIDNNLSYFYDLANAPMTAWTFSEVWQEFIGSYSVLTIFDRVAPTITNVSSNTANGSYNAGDVIDIDVTFSEWVTSTGNVTVTLETGDTDRTCTFTVSDASTGTCNYTVQAGDISGDLNVNSISGTIADSNGNAMTNFVPTTTLAANKAFIIDAVVPTISNVNSDKADGSYTVGEVIDIDITFSEAVTSTGNVTVTLETGATDRTCTFTVSAASSGTCNYTVQAGDSSLDLAVSSIAGTIEDSAGNAITNFVPTTTLATNTAFIIDTVAPTSVITYLPDQSQYHQGNQITITATFSEAMVDSPIPNIAVTGTDAFTATAMTKVDTTHYTYSHTVGSGTGTANVVLSIGTDAAGNAITQTPTSGGDFQLNNQGSGLTISQNSTTVKKLPKEILPGGILFKDISNSYAKSEITKLFEMGIIQGKTSTIYAPHDLLTRSEALKVVLLLMNHPISSDYKILQTYKDIDKNDWYAKFVATAIQRNIATGYTNEIFKPNTHVTRAEVLKMLLKSMGSGFNNPKRSPFLDVSSEDWFANFVDYAYLLGLVKGRTTEYFEPNAYITREEVAVLLMRAVNITNR